MRNNIDPRFLYDDDPARYASGVEGSGLAVISAAMVGLAVLCVAFAVGVWWVLR